jgi:predicted nucleic acid-binding protein
MHYVDTSVLVAYFVPEIYSLQAEQALRDTSRYPLALSAWTETEFVSALGIKCRTGQITDTQSLAVQQKYAEQMECFIHLPVTDDDFRAAGELLKRWRTGLRAGDALHLAVAHRCKAPLLSLDERLVLAAGQLGVAAEWLGKPLSGHSPC